MRAVGVERVGSWCNVYCWEAMGAWEFGEQIVVLHLFVVGWIRSVGGAERVDMNGLLYTSFVHCLC